MTVSITPEVIIVCCLCIITAFMFGFVAGLNLEYHTSNKTMQRQLENEAERLREIASMTPYLPTTQEVQP